MYYKFLESSLFSSWAFFFVIVPFIGAYASYRGLSFSVALWTISFSVPFVMLCSGMGMLITLCMVRWVPFGRKFWIVVIGGAALIVTKVVIVGMEVQYSLYSGPLMLGKIIPGLEFSSSPLLPSWWIAEGVMSFTREQWGRGVMLWMVDQQYMMMCISGVARLSRLSANDWYCDFGKTSAGMSRLSLFPQVPKKPLYHERP